MTLKELANAILALPEEQQNSLAIVHRPPEDEWTDETNAEVTKLEVGRVIVNTVDGRRDPGPYRFVGVDYQIHWVNPHEDRLSQLVPAIRIS